MAGKSANEPELELGADDKVGVGAFFERPSLVMFGLGFAAGMPNQLAGIALFIIGSDRIDGARHSNLCAKVSVGTLGRPGRDPCFG
jgi:hypothetical protein